VITELVLLAFAAYVVGSMVYVYRFRGTLRYAGFKQYLRKSWPLFAPLNCLLYLFTQARARHPIMDRERFPELEPIQRNWTTIRDEALALQQARMLEQTADPDSSAYYDIGFRTFYKYGWRKFYLKWYGTTHNSAQQHCPETLRILREVPQIKGAMFSVLPVGGKLTPHSDPSACSLRYHLGLATPNDDRCWIVVDGQDYSWRDGADLLFDETYQHEAHNQADGDRLILMCDVDRPTYPPGNLVNAAYRGLMRLTVVPNTSDDRRGLANNLYAGIAPTVTRIRGLKQTDRRRYQVIKHSVNFGLIASAALLIGGLAYGTQALVAGGL